LIDQGHRFKSSPLRLDLASSFRRHLGRFRLHSSTQPRLHRGVTALPWRCKNSFVSYSFYPFELRNPRPREELSFHA
jgi:hypothetical protein